VPTAKPLTVAVTGPTGTFGFGLLPLLEAEPKVGKVIGLARRPFDPAEHGFTKLEYRRGDVRDPAALQEAFEGSDVVVHLAFLITGNASREEIRAINVDGTLNVFRAARDAGVKRFVYASSIAAYGFHADNPVGMAEDWPVRPADRLFYAQEKAELEHLLEGEAAGAELPALYLLRPPIVLGPGALGAKAAIPEAVSRGTRAVLEVISRLPIPVPILAADVELQFIHEADVGQALLQCVLAAGPPGAYNIAGDGLVTGSQIARELGLAPIGLPAGAVHSAARAIANLPWPSFIPPAAEWVESLSHPSVMDTSKAKELLGFKPRYTAIEAVRDTLRASRSE
jgi:nucleoside-diphosphate-sugar epimerase